MSAPGCWLRRATLGAVVAILSAASASAQGEEPSLRITSPDGTRALAGPRR